MRVPLSTPHPGQVPGQNGGGGVPPHWDWMGYPPPSRSGLPSWSGWRYLPWDHHIKDWMGYPPVQDWRGYPPSRSGLASRSGWKYPPWDYHIKDWMGVPLIQDWMGIPLPPAPSGDRAAEQAEGLSCFSLGSVLIEPLAFLKYKKSLRFNYITRITNSACATTPNFYTRSNQEVQ